MERCSRAPCSTLLGSTGVLEVWGAVSSLRLPSHSVRNRGAFSHHSVGWSLISGCGQGQLLLEAPPAFLLGLRLRPTRIQRDPNVNLIISAKTSFPKEDPTLGFWVDMDLEGHFSPAQGFGKKSLLPSSAACVLGALCVGPGVRNFPLGLPISV